MSLVSIDGDLGEGGGQVLRTALTLSAVTGQGFEMTRVRARRSRPGLRPQHLAAVRAAAPATRLASASLRSSTSLAFTRPRRSSSSSPAAQKNRPETWSVSATLRSPG